MTAIFTSLCIICCNITITISSRIPPKWPGSETALWSTCKGLLLCSTRWADALQMDCNLLSEVQSLGNMFSCDVARVCDEFGFTLKHLQSASVCWCVTCFQSFKERICPCFLKNNDDILNRESVSVCVPRPRGESVSLLSPGLNNPWSDQTVPKPVKPVQPSCAAGLEVSVCVCRWTEMRPGPDVCLYRLHYMHVLTSVTVHDFSALLCGLIRILWSLELNEIPSVSQLDVTIFHISTVGNVSEPQCFYRMFCW